MIVQKLNNTFRIRKIMNYNDLAIPKTIVEEISMINPMTSVVIVFLLTPFHSFVINPHILLNIMLEAISRLHPATPLRMDSPIP